MLIGKELPLLTLICVEGRATTGEVVDFVGLFVLLSDEELFDLPDEPQMDEPEFRSMASLKDFVRPFQSGSSS